MRESLRIPLPREGHVNENQSINNRKIEWVMEAFGERHNRNVDCAPAADATHPRDKHQRERVWGAAHSMWSDSSRIQRENAPLSRQKPLTNKQKRKRMCFSVIRRTKHCYGSWFITLARQLCWRINTKGPLTQISWNFTTNEENPPAVYTSCPVGNNFLPHRVTLSVCLFSSEKTDTISTTINDF